ncbi:MAG: molybdopterin dinucleotide binding domain-containing protein, partial [Thermodesulfobacteriota bacterium]
LIRLAREFAENQPSLAIGYRDRPFHQMAVAVLNGLVGSIDREGGVLIPKSVPLKPLPSFTKDSIAQKGFEKVRIDENHSGPFRIDHPYLFAKNSTSGKPYYSKVLFLYYSNPLFSNPHPDLFQKAFDQIPSIVSFSPYMDDTTQFADLILPDHTPLERWQDDPVFLNNGFSVLGIRQPAINPLYQTRATGDVLIEIAKSLGGEIEKAFPWKDFQDLLLYGIRGIYEARRGDVFGLEFDEAWIRMLQKGGWWAPSYKSFEEFWKLILEKGGWWDPLYDFGETERIFKTPSKKFEFLSQLMKDSHLLSKDEGDKALLPHWEEPRLRDDEKSYPFHLNIFKTMALGGGRNANQPWLQEISSPHLFERWTTWVEINPKTAMEIGISDGDWIWVESSFGKIKAKARLYKGAMPQVVNIPFGLGHRSGGRWSKNIGENPYRLLGLELDPLTGQPIQGGTRVRIYKV